jgi:hypothetical protein
MALGRRVEAMANGRGGQIAQLTELGRTGECEVVIYITYASITAGFSKGLMGLYGRREGDAACGCCGLLRDYRAQTRQTERPF